MAIEIIYGLECQFPICPPPTQVDGYGLKEKQQKFSRVDIPESFDDLEYDEIPYIRNMRIYKTGKENKSFKNIEGNRFGKLIVIEDAIKLPNKTQNYCFVKCDCGNTKHIMKSSLIHAKTLSCGCIHKEWLIDRSKKHGLCGTKIYKLFRGIVSRCYYKKNKGYMYYGGRGISIHNEWLENPMCFYDWAMQNGYKEGLSIERIDVNGNYEPSNCKWIPTIEQSMNTRRTIYIDYNNKKYRLHELCKIYSVESKNVHAYIKRNGNTEGVIKKYFSQLIA